MDKLQKFLGHHPIGLITRVFAKKSEDVERQVDMLMELIHKAMAIDYEGKQVFSMFHVMIPRDARRRDVDCGETKEAIYQRIGDNRDMLKKVKVTEIFRGGLFCGALNTAAARQLAAGMHYSLIISPPARSYLNQLTMIDVVTQAVRGAKVVSIVTNEQYEPTLNGIPCNSACMWHLEELIGAGGFNPIAEQAVDDKGAVYLRGYNDQKGEYEYRRADGTEEVIVAGEILKNSMDEPCIAAVLPRGEGIKKYEIPPEGEERDRDTLKKITKRVRQEFFANMFGFDLSYLRGGMMPMLEEV